MSSPGNVCLLLTVDIFNYLYILEGISRPGDDVVLEERDPDYDAMLRKMVGRITTKPGGKPEMGEVRL